MFEKLMAAMESGSYDGEVEDSVTQEEDVLSTITEEELFDVDDDDSDMYDE